MILNRIELAESRIIREPEPSEPEILGTRRLDVPQPLEDLLTSIAKTRYGNLAAIPIVRGVDETVYYLDRATQWHLRRQPLEGSHALKMACIMRAYWLLQATKEADEYQAESMNTSYDELDGQLVRWGMTTRRFVSKLEEVRNGALLIPKLDI